MGALRTGDAALVESADWRGSAGSVIGRVDRRAADAKRHRIGGTTVILQDAEPGIVVNAGTGRIRIAQVSTAIDDEPSEVVAICSRWAVGKDSVLERRDATVANQSAAIVSGAVTGEGAIAHAQQAAVVDDAAAVVGAVVVKGAIAQVYLVADGKGIDGATMAGPIAVEGTVVYG